MKTWLHEVLISKDFWVSFSVAVIFLVAGKFSAFAVRLSRQVWQSHQMYSVSGFWIGDCILPSCGGERLIEIWRFVQRQDQIKITLFAYYPTGSLIDRCLGSGVFRGSYLSAIYYSSRRDSYESGVLALKLNNQRLRGTYAQYDIADTDEKFYTSDGEYTLTRVHLPFLKAAKMLLGKPPFRDYDEANTMYEQCCPRKNPVAAENTAYSTQQTQ
ncbi:MAG TPA: hypothetical protein VD835_15995 [Pyrinomonadaceae bacterium]|nr:hypothetical protein [Pyrinomonadaceae bacterium]